MTLAGLLVSLSGPIARQVLASLGIGVVTMAGVDVAIESLLSHAKTAWSGAVPAVAEYVAMAGFNTGLSILSGGIAARVALLVTKSFRVL